MTSICIAALKLALVWDLKVFPCRYNKRPACTNGFKDATDDGERIKELFASPSAVAIGLATGRINNIVVIDVDVKNGQRGGEWFEANHHRLLPTLTHATPSGGRHLLFRMPPHVVISSSVGKLAPGVDVRADGGYVIVPTSPGYTVVSDCKIADLPNWLLVDLHSAETQRPADLRAVQLVEIDCPSAIEFATQYARTVAPAVEDSGGDNHTFHVACGLHDLGVSEGTALGILLTEWNPRCSPSWDSDELARKVRNAFAYAKNAPGSKHPAADFEGVSIASFSQQADMARASFIDPWDMLQRPPFPMEILPPVLRAFSEDRARTIGADACAIAWAAISACSAAVDGSTRLRMKQNDKWAVPPSIWVMLVGASSSMKTPAIDAAWRPLVAAQSRHMAAWEIAKERYDALPKEEQMASGKLAPPSRYVTQDGTPEAIQNVLTHQGRGIGMLYDELIGFFEFDRYSGKRGGSANRAFFLVAYNGAPFTFDRVGRGHVNIENLLVAICGGIQPARLVKLTDLTDDGLFQRFVPIILRPGTLGMDDPTSGSAVAEYEAMVDRLLAYRPPAEPLRLSDGAHAVRRRVEKEVFDHVQGEALGPSFAAFCGKLNGLFGRLCLVLHCIESTGLQEGNGIISAEVAEAARALVMDSALPNAAAVYLTMGSGHGSNLEATQAIAGYILAKEKVRFVVSDLTSNVQCCRNCNLADIHNMLSPLVAGGWLEPETGFPSNRAWTVMPGLHAAFRERAEKERARREAARKIILRDARHHGLGETVAAMGS